MHLFVDTNYTFFSVTGKSHGSSLKAMPQSRSDISNLLFVGLVKERDRVVKLSFHRERLSRDSSRAVSLNYNGATSRSPANSTPGMFAPLVGNARTSLTSRRVHPPNTPVISDAGVIPVLSIAGERTCRDM